MNQIIISGRLTRDPEFRTSQSGLAVTSFSVAVDRPYTKGEKKADFIDCVAFRKTAEFVSKYFMKGKPILVVGHLQSRDWEDKNGMKRRSWEVIVDNVEFCGGEKANNAQAPAMQEIPMGDDDLPWKDSDMDDLPL